MGDTSEDLCKGILPFLVVTATLGGFLFGYDTGVISGTIDFIASDFSLSDQQKEMVVSATVLGAVASCFFGFAFSQGGRWPMLMMATIFYMGGSAIVSSAMSYAVLLVGRVVLGLGVGVASFIVPMYISECASSKHRASLITTNNLLIVLGQVTAGIGNVLVDGLPADENWRITMGCAAIPATVMAVSLMFLPESPRYLLSKQKEQEALNVLQRIRGQGEEVQQEVKSIQISIAAERSDMGFREMWCDPSLRRLFILGIGTHICSQFAGINTMMYYGADVMRYAGVDSKDAVAMSCVLAAIQAAGVLVSMWLHLHYSRRTVYFGSFAGVILSLCAIASAFLDIKKYNLVGIVAISTYLFSFGAGLSSMPYIVNSEIYPLYAKATGNAQSAMAMWLANFIVADSFLTLVDYIGQTSVFFIYAAVSCCFVLWFYFELPETKNKTLEQASDEAVALH